MSDGERRERDEVGKRRSSTGVMFFDGDHRVRRKKVQLGGRSKARASVQDRQNTVQYAKKQREERQRARKEQQAAQTIGSFVRGRLIAKREARRIRKAWIKQNGPRGERLLVLSNGEASKVEDLLLSTRQLVFFVQNSKADALRLCALCDAACSKLRNTWLDEAYCVREGRLPSLCNLLISRSISLLSGLEGLTGDEPTSQVPPQDIRGRVVSSLLEFLVTFLDLENAYGDEINAAISRTLAFVVKGGLFRCIANLLKTRDNSNGELPDAKLQSDIGLLAFKLVGKCLHGRHYHVELLDLLTLKGVFDDVFVELREPFWEGLMEATSKSQPCVEKMLVQYSEENAHITMLNNFLKLSKDQTKQADHLTTFIGLMDSLMTASLGSLGLGPKSEDAMDCDVTVDFASEKSNLIVSVLTENIEMWNGLSKSILPSGPDEEMSERKLRGTIALISLLSKLITHCGDAQLLAVMLTSLAFKVNFLETLWFFTRKHLDLMSISEEDQDNISKAIIVICTVHVLRLQIINDKEFYQQNLLMDISKLNDIVVYIKTYISKVIDKQNLRVEDLEGNYISWYDKMVFQKAVDHLDKLHEQNGRYHIIDEESFHLKIGADEGFFKDLESGGRAKLVCTFCPYFIPFHDRVKIFRYYLEQDRSEYYSNLPPEERMNPYLSARTVVIRRQYILEDGYSKLDRLGQALKCIVRIQFINELGEDEAGVDGGGLFKDFLENLITTAFDTQYGFFCANPENKLYPHPSSSSVAAEHLNYFRFFGRMIGKAIYEGILVDVPFADFFLRKIRGKSNGFDDLQSLDKELHTNLCFLRGYDGKVEDLGLYFAVEQNNYGKVELENLIPHGKDTAVTNANVIKYIHLLANFKLNVQLKRQLMAFMQGLQDLVNQEWIALFNDSELQELISGSAKGFDLEDMRKNMHYSGGYNESHPVIKMFWDTVSQFNVEEQASLLKFVTACSRPPLLGFKYLEPKLCIQKAGNEEKQLSRLPTAATCMNLLKLPPYSSAEEMTEKIRYAINAGAGFDLS